MPFGRAFPGSGKVLRTTVSFVKILFTNYKIVTISTGIITKTPSNLSLKTCLSRKIPSPERPLGKFTVAIFAVMVYNGYRSGFWCTFVHKREAKRTGVNGLEGFSLRGLNNVTMDAKGRITFPAKLRDVIGSRFIITKGIDGCLFVYSCETFEAKAEKIRALPMAKARTLQRTFMAWACEVETDKQGKLLIPKELREAAGLDKDVVIAGVSERCEIWDKTRWEEYNASAEAELAETLEGLDF